MGDAKARIILSNPPAVAKIYYIDSGDDRIMAINHTEQEWSQVAQVVLQDSDATIADLSFQGWKCHIYWGYGADYSLCAPLWCIAQKTDSRGTSIITALSLAGTFNLMNEDRASTSFIPDHNDAKTVKDLLRELCAGQFSAWQANTTYAVGDFVRATTTNGKVFKCTAIAGDEKSGSSEPTWDTEVGNTTVDDQVTWTCRGGEMTSYSHVKSYTATFDDTTGIIDTFAPKDSFRVYLNDSRLSKIKQLMQHVGYKVRVEGDEEIHFFIPVTSGSSYDEEYNDAVTGHNFFEKGVRKRVVIPGYFVVSSHPDHLSPFAGFTGFAKDSGYDSLPTDLQKRIFKYFRVTSNAQCTSIAGNLLIHKQIDAEKGHGFAIMNCLQEVFDYVNITDSKVGDTRAGTIGYINRKYLATGRPEDFSMQFRFGSVAPGLYLGTQPPVFSDGVTFDDLNDALDYVERILLFTSAEIKDEIIQLEPDAGIPAGGADGAINWTSLFDGSTDTPTSVDWALETGLPFTKTSSVFFSPVIEEVPNTWIVYVIDRGTEFWKYNITTKEWSKLASPSAANTIYRSLAPNPLGTKLATITDLNILSIYDIATDAWTNSATAPQISGTDVQMKSVVWEDNDIIWAWAERGTQKRGKCFKYVISTTTWSQGANETGVQATWLGAGAAIKADGTIVYGLSIGGAGGGQHTKYTVGSDTYAQLADDSDAGFAYVYDKDKLWYAQDTSLRLGYMDTADESFNDGQFARNLDIAGGWGFASGISDDLTYAINEAAGSAPELHSVIAGGNYLLGTIYASGWITIIVEKPDDNFPVLFVNTADNITLSYDHSVQGQIWDGTWKVYYPQNGDYTQIRILYGVP